MYKKVIFFLVCMLTYYGCEENTHDAEAESSELTLVKYKMLLVAEPSDLALDIDNKRLWIVSDHGDGGIGYISLEGATQKSFSSLHENPEGITVVNSNLLAVVYENSHKVVLYDTSGNILRTKNVYFNTCLDYGTYEGITYNKKSGHYYFANNKYPAAIIELDSSFNFINAYPIKDARNLTGVFYEEDENVIWIVSDEDYFLGKFDTSFNLLKSYKFDLRSCEGVSVDYKNKLIYLVSGTNGKLCTYKLE